MVSAAVISLLSPVVALVAWTLFMEVWLYSLRIPAVLAMKVKYNPATQLKDEFHKQMPVVARWVGDNYNHLHEQPTCFYAIMAVLAIAHADPTKAIVGVNSSTVTLAWAYVLLRVAHSFFQALVNIVNVRFALFISSSIVLALLTFHAASLTVFA